MPFQIVRDRIDTVWCDAVVDTSAQAALDHYSLLLSTDSFQATDEAPEDYDTIGTIGIGEYELRRANGKNCQYIINTLLPEGLGSFTGPEIIRHCYRRALEIASDFDLKSVAFPLIGSESDDCPKEMALEIASEEIRSFLSSHEDTNIILVIPDKRDFRPSPSLLLGLEEYIRYIEQQERRKKEEQMMLDNASTGAFPAITLKDINEERRKQQPSPTPLPQTSEPVFSSEKRRSGFSWHRKRREEAVPSQKEERPKASKPGLVLPFGPFQPERGAALDESFSQMVLRKIDEKGFEKDSDCYCKANIDRRLFSRLRCDENYHPKKTTAVALAIALELPLNETNELLMKAGYSLSHSIMFDVIIEYCILQNNYDIFEINELLFKYDQPLLGA